MGINPKKVFLIGKVLKILPIKLLIAHIKGLFSSVIAKTHMSYMQVYHKDIKYVCGFSANKSEVVEKIILEKYGISDGN